MSNQSHPAISARGLTKRFDDFTAVDKVEFDVHPGEIFGFLGPNGSGKTTTIRMTLGLMRPSQGSIEVLGMPVDGDTTEIRPRVGYMSQRFSLYNDLTVLQNLQFYGNAYGLSNSALDSRIQEALEMSGLVGRERTKTRDLSGGWRQMSGLVGRERTKTRDLSGGWRQRLSLSAAILHRPEILFLDEPTAGVDPISRRVFWDLLYRQVASGVTVFVTTHYMDEAEHCHRLAFIQRGKLIAYGSPEEIKREKMVGQVLEIEPSDAIQTIQILRAAQESGELLVDEIELYGSLVHVVAPQVRTHQPAIEDQLRGAGIDPGSMVIIEPSLEDVFIASMK
jgi:ABC-2 type transport system ATP-binding protein